MVQVWGEPPTKYGYGKGEITRIYVLPSPSEDRELMDELKIMFNVETQQGGTLHELLLIKEQMAEKKLWTPKCKWNSESESAW